ncbi:MAG: uroporphyrinogen-III C-methyltransferase, partial [Actinomycetales bacterium]|nr:uroporphyrinogen-III C-methyltransferase [Actinomycetales bacterium]
MDTGELPVRATRPGRRTGIGTVHLVGGGPGDEGLITVRGRRLLATADVVVVDRLAPRGLLDQLPAGVEVIDCGKSPGHHQLTQDQINDVIVDRALHGQDVVRLKGGDPFVLGRGGEEALACHAAGVPVEVVPGVTSAVSVPAAAGIPVTHRGVASSFALVSAHDGVEPVERAAHEHAPSTTLVLLMGVRQLRDSAAALVTAGRDPATPVAVVERGWTPLQRTTIGTLADIADTARDRGVASPAVVVVGHVVSLREALGAFSPELP